MLVYQLIFNIIKEARVGRVIMDANFNLIDKTRMWFDPSELFGNVIALTFSSVAASQEYQTFIGNYKFNYGCNSRISMMTPSPCISRMISGILTINCYCITWFCHRSFSIELVLQYTFMINYYCHLKMEITAMQMFVCQC